MIGVILIIIAIILAIIIYSFTLELNSNLHDTCINEEGFCPHAGTLPPISYFSFTVVLILGLFGLFLIVTSRKEKLIEIKGKEKVQAAIGSLSGDEKKIYEMIVEADGTSFQSELIKESGLSKVKMSRVLDRLEGKGLIDRRRRGMTNVVVLKH